MPKKYKYRKVQRGVATGTAKGGINIVFGNYGLVAKAIGFITSRQIESARVSISRELKREGKLWIRIFPHKPISKRPAETRMGKGKGDVDHYVAVVKPGCIMFEVGGVSIERARRAMQKASYKLPIGTDFVQRKF